MTCILIAVVFAMGMAVPAAFSQDDNLAWVQIEAQPSLSEAQERIRAYASQLQDINGFAMGSGWYGIALGPYNEDDANQVLRNLRQVLEAAGSGMSRVLRCDVFLLDLEDFGRMNEVYSRHFPDDPPARVTVQAARLPKDARVEIAAIAVR